MPLFGPRLDRPSAVGDEGRPRATSLWIASLVVVLVSGGAGLAIGQPSLLPSMGTFVGVTIAGIGLANRDRFRPLLAGHVLLLFFGSLLSLWVLLSLTAPYGLGIAGVAIAMLGIGLAWANVEGYEGTKRILLGIGISYVTMTFSLVLVVMLVVVLLVGGLLVDATTTGLSPVASLTWFLGAVGYAAASLRLLLWQFPVEQLVAYDRREAWRDRLAPVGWGLIAVAVAMPLAMLLSWVATVAGVVDTLVGVARPVALVLDALAHPVVLGVPGVVGTAALLGVVAVVALRLATRQFDETSARFAAAAAAGACVAGLVLGSFGAILLYPALNRLVFALMASAAVNLGPLTMALLGLLGLMAVGVGLVPDRAGGPALSAAGLVVAAIGFGGTYSVVPFAAVAGAIVVWDVSAFGLGLTAELGHLPETRRLELFHGVIVAGIGVVTVAALTALDLLRTTLLVGVGGTAALFVAGVGVFLLLAPLRG